MLKPARWAQEVVERQGGSLEIETKLKRMQNVVKRPEGKSWDQVQEIAERYHGGKFRYWNQMNAPKWGTSTQVDIKLSPCATERPEEGWRVEIEKKRAEWEGGGKLNVSQGEGRCSLESIDIETQWMQEVWEVWWGAHGGKLDIETRWAQEVVESQGKPRILKPNACRKLLRGTGVQEKFGHWNNIKARSCGEANGGKPTYETKWMHEVERHIGGKRKLDIQTRWAQ